MDLFIPNCYDIFKDENSKKRAMQIEAIVYRRNKAVENRIKRDMDAIRKSRDMKNNNPFWRIVLKSKKTGELIDIECLQHSISDTEYICKNCFSCNKEELRFNMAEYTSILRDYNPIS